MPTPPIPTVKQRIAKVLSLLESAEEEIAAIGGGSPPSAGDFADPEGKDAWPEVEDTLTALRWQLHAFAPALSGALDPESRRAAC